MTTCVPQGPTDYFISAWIPNTELALLDVESEAVTNPVEKGKSKPLLQAYAKAAENNDMEHFKTMLVEHQKALEADIEEREERAAKKASKKSRKSMDASALAEDVDEMDIDEDIPAEKPKSKKRKKADDSEDVEEKVILNSILLNFELLTIKKPAKTPKTTRVILSAPKTPTTEPSGKKKAAKKSTKAAKATKSASEEEVVTPKAEEKPLTPQQAKEVKEKKGETCLQSLQG